MCGGVSVQPSGELALVRAGLGERGRVGGGGARFPQARVVPPAGRGRGPVCGGGGVVRGTRGAGMKSWHWRERGGADEHSDPASTGAELTGCPIG